MSSTCGSTDTRSGEPCGFPSSDNCPHHPNSGLTDKQRRFVEEYTVDFNATQAAIRAGYSEDTAYSIGSENLKKPEIDRAIRSRLNELAMSADEALKRLADWARGDVGDLIELRGDEGHWVLDLEKARERGKLHLIKEISYDANGQPKVKLYDAKDAVKQIARAHGVFVDKIEHSGPEGGPIEVDVDDARERLDRRIARIAERRGAASGAPTTNGAGG